MMQFVAPGGAGRHSASA